MRRASPPCALLITCMALLSGCGGGASRQRSAATSGASAAAVGIDSGINERGQWLTTRRGSGAIAILKAVPADGSNHRFIPVRLSGVGYPAYGMDVTRTFVGPGIDARWSSINNQYSVSVESAGPRISLVVWSRGGTWTASIDGRNVTGVPRLVGSAEAPHSLDLDVSRLAGAGRHLITFSLAEGVWVEGLKLASPADQVGLPKPAAGPSVYWLGDSYTVGSGAAYPGFSDFTHIADQAAGLQDVTIDALGGTGYLRTNQIAHFPNFSRVLSTLGPHHVRPQWMVIAGSINDDGLSPSRLGTAAATLYAHIRQISPQTKIIVVPFTSAYPVPAPIASSNGAILRAARAAPNVVGVLNLPERVMAMGGRIGAARDSTGLTSKRVAYHPSQLGHQVYGQLIGAFIKHCMSTVTRDGVRGGVCDQ